MGMLYCACMLCYFINQESIRGSTYLSDSPFSPVPNLVNRRAEVLEEGANDFLACLLPLVKVLVFLPLNEILCLFLHTVHLVLQDDLLPSEEGDVQVLSRVASRQVPPEQL